MIDKSSNYGRSIIREFLLSSVPFENILDIGVGEGVDLSTAKEIQKDCNLYSIEYYKPAIEKLKSNHVDVVNINIENEKFPYKDNQFDIIIANQILEHCKEVFWILHEVSRILKIGGYFIIGVPNLASFHNRLLLLAGRQPTCLTLDGPHVRGLTTKGVLSLLDSCWPAGYNCLSLKGSNFYPFPPIIANTLSYFLPNFAVVSFFLLRKEKKYNNNFINFLLDKNTPLETKFFTGDL